MAGTRGVWGLSGCVLGLWLTGLFATSGCDPAEIVLPPDGGGAAGGALPYDAGSGGGGPDASGGSGPAVDAGTTPLLLGLSPNPSGAGGGLPSEAEKLQAQLTTYAVGVRVVRLERAWATLAEDGVEQLASEVASYRERDLAVVLQLLVVDRKTDHRPASLAGEPWSSPATVDSLKSTIDEVLTEMGEELHSLVLGRETDAYLTAHPEAASDMVDLMSAAILHAEGFADGEPPSGVGLSFVGMSPSAAYGQLLDLGQLAVWSYQPGLGASQVPNDTSAAKDLDTMIELAGTQPIVLTAAGASSAEALGSDPEAQRQYFTSLFGALEARRRHFAAVHVDELHDRTGADCAQLATSRGETDDGDYAEFACSRGLKDADGVAKPAWLSFVQGAAAFASP